MKVFISYAREDRATAGTLDTDLHDAGATTFLYGRYRDPGSFGVRSHRVRAKGGLLLGDSAWSAPVNPARSPRA